MASDKFKQVPQRRARNSLSRDVILDAAAELALTNADISIRNVASILQCSAMALYRHFPDKDALLLALLDRVIGSVELWDQTEPWDARLLSIAKGHLRTLQENPWAIPLLFQFPDPGPAVRKLGEAILSALKEGGASDDIAVRTFSSILAMNYGWAGFTAKKSDPNGVESLAEKLNAAPSSRDGLPLTSKLWPEFSKLGSHGHHEAAIRQLILISNS